MRGCNYMSSDCVNRIDQWQEYGFDKRLETVDRELALAEEIGYNSVRLILEFPVWEREHDGFMKRLDRYLTVCKKHGIDAMLCLANDCSVPKDQYQPPVFGEIPYDLGYFGGKAVSPHKDHGGKLSWHILDDPDTALRYCGFVRKIIAEYAHDDRVSVWNLFNEPGNNRASLSLPHMKRFFEIAWEIAPDQPCCADVWSGFTDDHANTEIEQAALEMSDIVSYHQYGSYESNIAVIESLRKIGRPALNTEWLHRINGNTVELMYPLFYLEKIGCYNFGFVAGKYQLYEPWEGIWQQVEAGNYALDVTKWMHDLFRPSLRPYDPREIRLIKAYNQRADERFKSGSDPVSL